jgi:uncharacterized membrane protein
VAEVVATLACGIFFGAALYISVVQHPATLEAGAAFANRFFAPMYRRAAVLQVGAAILGTAAGVQAWLHGSGPEWLAGAIALFAVMPFTVIFMLPLNAKLVAAEPAGVEALLRRWASLHLVRTVLSAVAFVAFAAGSRW